MPTAFVTGGSGFVGGALIERLRAEGWDVGALAAAGTVGGVALVNVLQAHVTKIAFAVLLLFTAAQMTRRALAPATEAEPREAGS